jgi:hypothetical protein
MTANVPQTTTFTSGQPIEVWLPLPGRRVFTLTNSHLRGQRPILRVCPCGTQVRFAEITFAPGWPVHDEENAVSGPSEAGRAGPVLFAFADNSEGENGSHKQSGDRICHRTVKIRSSHALRA